MADRRGLMMQPRDSVEAARKKFKDQLAARIAIKEAGAAVAASATSAPSPAMVIAIKPVAIVELSNECHLPAGPGGGQFCERLGSVKTRSKPLLKTHVAGSGPRMSIDLIGDKAVNPTIDRIAAVPGFEDFEGKSGREILNQITDRMADNVLNAAESAFAVSPEGAALHASWYPRANKFLGDLAGETGFHKNSVIAAAAVLSPSSDWSDNIAWTKRVAERVGNEKNIVVSDAAAQAYYFTRLAAYEGKKVDHEKKQATVVVEAGGVAKPFRGVEPNYPSHIVGKKLSELSNLDAAIAIRGEHDLAGGGKDAVRQLGGAAGFGDPRYKSIPQSDENMTKAVSVLRDGSAANVDVQIGNEHKVRSFRENLRDPLDDKFSEATIDTHAYGVGVGLPLTVSSPFIASGTKSITAAPSTAVTGVKGAYPLGVEAYRRATTAFNKKHGTNFRANQIQSITWEYHRAIYPEKQRGPKMQEAIAGIRTLRARGLISKAEEKIRIEAARTLNGGPTIEEIRKKYATDVKAGA